MKPIILGSQSPRRVEIMNYFSLPFIQKASLFDEESVPFLGNPEAYAKAISEGKNRALAEQFPEETILTADTIVYRNGKIYGKPANEEMAAGYLSELVGEWHSVFTSVTLKAPRFLSTEIAETKVLFNPLKPEQIAHYHRKIHWADKAGGYAIQMAGGLLVNRIEGCYYNVLGLPINVVRSLLQKIDIELWDYLKNGC